MSGSKGTSSSGPARHAGLGLAAGKGHQVRAASRVGKGLTLAGAHQQAGAGKADGGQQGGHAVQVFRVGDRHHAHAAAGVWVSSLARLWPELRTPRRAAGP